MKFMQTAAYIFSPDVKLTEFRTSVTSERETYKLLNRTQVNKTFFLKIMETLTKNEIFTSEVRSFT